MPRRYRCLLFAAIGVLVAGAAPSQPAQQNRVAQQGTAAAKADERGSQNAPVWVQVIPGEKSARERAKDEAQEARQAQTDTWMVVLTGILAALGFAQVVVTAITLRGLRHAETSARAAEDAADAAKRGVEIATETARTQLRAYVYAELDGSLEVTATTLEAHVRPSNQGQTPAYSYRCCLHIAIAPYPDPGDLPEVVFTNIGSRFDLAPGRDGGFIPDTLMGITPEQWSGIKARTMAAYLYGRIIYDDVFGEHHITDFRWAAVGDPLMVHLTAEGNKST